MRIAVPATMVACILVAGLAPALAAAQGDGAKPREIVLFAEANDEWEAALGTFGNLVYLELARGYVSALYVVPGRVSNRRIDARFGRLGRISGRYERVDLFGRREQPDASGCKDPFSFVAFRGRISFEGEGGYTSIDERRTGGLLSEPAARRCKSRAHASAAPATRQLDTHLSTIAKRGDVVTSFTLSRRRGQHWVQVEAQRYEQRGRMEVLRESFTAVGGENAFIASGPRVRPPFAFIAPPKPFSGSALFDGAALPGAKWTGDLSAWLPGAGKVRLTGPDYALSFCRRAASEPPCDPETPVRRLSSLQGSGSQSQALGEARLSWSRYLLNSASSAGSTP